MNTNYITRAFVLLLVSCMPAAALAESPSAESAQLHQLDVSAGRWEYHGHFLARKGAHPDAWVWHEDCRWSDNRVFMLCSFSNTWAGRHVDSIVVDTYDGQNNTFWHYARDGTHWQTTATGTGEKVGARSAMKLLSGKGSLGCMSHTLTLQA